ncbi:SatD family protein [Algoriphagus boritolerans]|uniref:SatD family (SatD) n=1 Tax=Algoriphagus boritolerans DSM 17298 = JCM 18970 TaxID=1120964 RepID=A0A1H5VHH1_9BACT|nr:SatD family protein [Algoriphagus boritolerans]SEF86506.1 SatD family (SatD) [Algoriphagus boritolerans DSM 17298 = JCM 18970]
MIAVIKGDIIHSRKLKNPEVWLKPLQQLFSQWGETPKNWELVWGDFFQLEIDHPEEAIHRAIQIKILIKKIQSEESRKNSSPIDVRMAIGIGEKNYSGSKISESNGPAFVFAGEKFDRLKKEKINLAIQSPWKELDEEINLYLKLAGILMDSWTISSAELMEVVLNHPNITQEEIGAKLGIKQNSVSGRWNRTHGIELMEIEKVYRKKIKKLIP